MYQYYRLEVSLRKVEPRIWRIFLLRREATFYDLHKAIQEACGWEDYHLFRFGLEPFGPAVAGIPDDEVPTPDAKKIKLTSFFDKHQALLYEYDFGDGWIHNIKLLDTIELPYKFKRALLDGQRAFPPEDSGGIGGYERLVAFIETGVDEWDDDPEGLKMWLRGWTPEAFNLNKTKIKFDK